MAPGAGIIVASLGFNWRRAWLGIASTGLVSGGTLIIVGSHPRAREAVAAAESLAGIAGDTFPGARVIQLWLDPLERFGRNVARIRDAVLESPSRASGVWFVASGGFRWLVLALSFAAQALRSLEPFTGARVEGLRFDIEAEMEGHRTGDEPLGSVVIESVPPLAAGLQCPDLQVLDALALLGGLAKARDVSREAGIGYALAARRLRRLERLGMVTREYRWRGYLYMLTETGHMLAGTRACT